MNIAPADLANQFYRARADWPFLDEVERAHGLPRCLLYAVGSRETNLTDERGDGGHGHGVWQYDDRTKGREAAIERIDAHDVHFAADIAAGMLVSLYNRYGDWTAACNAYNSGQPQTGRTTGHDYGPDVMSRCRFLAGLASPTPAPAPPNPQPVMEDDMPVAFDPINGDFWVLTGPEGGIDARRADGSTSPRYYGNLIDHPEYNAGAGKPLGPAIAVGYWPAGLPVEGEPAGGYVIVTCAPDGSYHPYHFDRSTLK